MEVVSLPRRGGKTGALLEMAVNHAGPVFFVCLIHASAALLRGGGHQHPGITFISVNDAVTQMSDWRRTEGADALVILDDWDVYAPMVKEALMEGLNGVSRVVASVSSTLTPCHV